MSPSSLLPEPSPPPSNLFCSDAMILRHLYRVSQVCLRIRGPVALDRFSRTLSSRQGLFELRLNYNKDSLVAEKN